MLLSEGFVSFSFLFGAEETYGLLPQTLRNIPTLSSRDGIDLRSYFLVNENTIMR